jgi:hypothetical protein
VPGDVRTEVPFALHVVAWWTVMGSTLWVLTRAADARWIRIDRVPLLTSWWLLTALMLAVEVGWRVTGHGGLDPIDSQVRWLQTHAVERSGLAIGPLKVRRRAASSEMHVSVRSQPDEAGHLLWDPVAGLPAGQYEVTLQSARVVPGTVAFRFGRAREPFLEVSLPPKAQHQVLIRVPEQSGPLSIEPGATLRPAIRRVVIRVVGAGRP